MPFPSRGPRRKPWVVLIGGVAFAGLALCGCGPADPLECHLRFEEVRSGGEVVMFPILTIRNSFGEDVWVLGLEDEELCAGVYLSVTEIGTGKKIIPQGLAGEVSAVPRIPLERLTLFLPRGSTAGRAIPVRLRRAPQYTTRFQFNKEFGVWIASRLDLPASTHVFRASFDFVGCAPVQVPVRPADGGPAP